jgi:two-component system, OmpR family, sensor histidine kinase KdpD
VVAVTPVESATPAERRSPAARLAVPCLAVRCLGAIVLVAAPAAVGWFLAPAVPSAGIVMLFLLAAVLAGLYLGTGPAAIVATGGGLAFNYLFTEPRFSFQIHDFGEILTFGALLTVGLVIATLAARARNEARIAQEHESQARALSDFTMSLLRSEDEAAIVAAAESHISTVFDAAVTLTLTPPEADRRRESNTVGDDAAQATQRRPVYAAGREAAVLSVRFRERDGGSTVAGAKLLAGYLSQIAMALERVELMRQRSDARIAAQAEDLRNALLAGLSHDLRTPLASILGSASAMLEPAGRLEHRAAQDLALTIHDEAARMNRLISNLLEMASLTRGLGRLAREWIPVEEIIGSVRHRLAGTLQGRPVTVELAADLPLIHVDGLLFEQLLQNLVENAARYTPPSTAIDISAAVADSGEGRQIRIVVADRGPGIADADKERVFEKFTRLGGESAQSGLGLGLPLCRSIVTLHGGSLTLTDRAGGGAEFRIQIPAGEHPPLPVDLETAE